MDRFEAAARGAYVYFRSAGGKLIIVKCLGAYSYGKALYKCTTLMLIVSSSTVTDVPKRTSNRGLHSLFQYQCQQAVSIVTGTGTCC